MLLHVNRQREDEAPGFSTPIPKPRTKKRDTRDAVMPLWDISQLSKSLMPGIKHIKNMEFMVRYAIEYYSRRKRIQMDVPKMIKDWHKVIVTLCTAHSRKDIDKAEYKMDELLSPILAAPVAELRAFYNGLSTSLEKDKQVPFFVWSIFNAWGEIVVKPSTEKSKIKRLRRKLALEIAEMVDDKVRPDITKAIIGALMWRDNENLKEIKADLKAGAKPRLRGKESCLFLVTKLNGQPEKQVML